MKKHLARRHLIYIGVAVLAIGVLVAPVLAGGGQFFAPTSTTYGSMIWNGVGTGLGNDAYTLTLSGTAIPNVSCYAPGSSNPAPGQNPPKLSSKNGSNAYIPAFTETNGKATFTNLTVHDPDTSGLTAKQIGCPNNNWTFAVNWWDWISGELIAYDTSTGGNMVADELFNCTTNPPSGSNPPTISCTYAGNGHH